MEVFRRREEVGAVVPLVAVLQGQQVEHELVSLCVFLASMPKQYPFHLKK